MFIRKIYFLVLFLMVPRLDQPNVSVCVCASVWCLDLPQIPYQVLPSLRGEPQRWKFLVSTCCFGAPKMCWFVSKFQAVVKIWQDEVEPLARFFANLYRKFSEISFLRPSPLNLESWTPLSLPLRHFLAGAICSPPANKFSQIPGLIWLRLRISNKSM